MAELNRFSAMSVSVSMYKTAWQGVTFILGSRLLDESCLVNNYQANSPCLCGTEYITLK